MSTKRPAEDEKVTAKKAKLDENAASKLVEARQWRQILQRASPVAMVHAGGTRGIPASSFDPLQPPNHKRCGLFAQPSGGILKRQKIPRRLAAQPALIEEYTSQ